MKQIKLLALLILFSVFTSGYTKHVALKYNDYNLVFSGSVVSEKNEAPMLTLKSLSSGMVCSGKPQVTEVMFFNYINPVYNGIFGKSSLSCNDGTRLFINWQVKKMIVNNVNGTAEDAYGHKLSFYVDKNSANADKKLEQYKKDVASKPSLTDYTTNLFRETPPVLNTQVAPENTTPVSVPKVEKTVVKVVPAVAKKDVKSNVKNVADKKVKTVAPKVEIAPKAVEKPKAIEKVKEEPPAVKKEVNITQKQAPKAVEAEKKVVPVANEVKINKEEKIIEKKSETVLVPQQGKAVVDVKKPSKEVVQSFNSDKKTSVVEVKKFQSAISEDQHKEKLKNINESSPVANQSNVFSMKNLFLKFTFGYNVANPAQKF